MHGVNQYSHSLSIFHSVFLFQLFDFGQTFIENKLPTAPKQSFLCGHDDDDTSRVSPVKSIHSHFITANQIQSHLVFVLLCPVYGVHFCDWIQSVLVVKMKDVHTGRNLFSIERNRRKLNANIT